MRPFSGLSFCDRFLSIDCRPIPSGGFRDLLVGVTNKSRKPPLGIGRRSMPRKRSQQDSPGNGRVTEILHKTYISGHGLNVCFFGPSCVPFCGPLPITVVVGARAPPSACCRQYSRAFVQPYMNHQVVGRGGPSRRPAACVGLRAASSDLVCSQRVTVRAKGSCSRANGIALPVLVFASHMAVWFKRGLRASESSTGKRGV